MYHPIVKEQELPGQLEELQTNPDNTETLFESQALIPGKIARKICRRIRGGKKQSGSRTSNFPYEKRRKIGAAR
jgi:hypothetical protein